MWCGVVCHIWGEICGCKLHPSHDHRWIWSHDQSLTFCLGCMLILLNRVNTGSIEQGFVEWRHPEPAFRDHIRSYDVSTKSKEARLVIVLRLRHQNIEGCEPTCSLLSSGLIPNTLYTSFCVLFAVTGSYCRPENHGDKQSSAHEWLPFPALDKYSIIIRLSMPGQI